MFIQDPTVDSDVREELSRLATRRSLLFASLAAALTASTTAIDLLRLSPTAAWVQILDRDWNGIAFALAMIVVANCAWREIRFTRQELGSVHPRGMTLSAATALLVLAHTLGLIILGTTVPVSEVYLLIAVLAVAGFLPVPVRLFQTAVVLAAAVTVWFLLARADALEDSGLHVALVAIVSAISCVIAARSNSDWEQMIFHRFKNERLALERAQFARLLAHDLRNPISSMPTLISLCREQSHEDGYHGIDEDLSVLEQAATSSRDMLEALLSWGQRWENERSIAKDNLDLDRAVSHAVDELRGQARAKGIDIDVACDAAVRIISDRELLRVLIRNVLSNAVKFTPEGGTITVRTHSTRATASVEVSDEGPGFDPETAAVTSGTAGERGTGLGLRIVKAIAEQLAGEVRVESRAGGGTTVKIEVPFQELQKLKVRDGE